VGVVGSRVWNSTHAVVAVPQKLDPQAEVFGGQKVNAIKLFFFVTDAPGK
jgi:hypothetical protein